MKTVIRAQIPLSFWLVLLALLRCCHGQPSDPDSGAASGSEHVRLPKDGGIVTVLWLNSVFLGIGLVLYFLLVPKFRVFFIPQSSYREKGLPDEEKWWSLSSYNWRYVKSFFRRFVKAFRHSESDVHEICGLEALLLLRYIRLIGYFLIAITTLALIILLPINLSGKDHSFDDRHGFSKTVASNLHEGSSKLWAHAVMATVFTVLAFLMVWYLQMKYFSSQRHYGYRHHAGPQTVFVKGLSPQRFKASANLHQMFETMYPGKVAAAHLVYDLHELQRLENERESILSKLERFNAILRKEGHRPMVVTVRDIRTDGIHHFKERLVRCDQEIAELLSFPLSSTGKGFVTFVDKQTRDLCLRDFLRVHHPSKLETIIRAAKASEERIFGRGGAFMENEQEDENISAIMRDKTLAPNLWIQEAPASSDVFFSHLRHSSSSHRARKVITWIMLVLVAFLWSIPIVFLASLSNITAIPGLGDGLQWILDLNGTVQNFLEAYLPTVFLYLVALALPKILRKIAMEQKPHYRFWLHGTIMKMHFVFLLLNTVIFPTVFLSTFDIFEKVFNSEEPVNAIWEAVQSVDFAVSGAFYINVFLQQSLLGTAFTLLQPRRFVVRLWRTRVRKVYTAREWKEANPPEPDTIGSAYADLLIRFTLAFLFTPVVPLLGVAAIFAIGLTYYVEKYKCFYVHAYEYGGASRIVFPVTRLLLFGVFFGQAGLAVFFSIKGMAELTIVMLLLMLSTILYYVYLRYRYLLYELQTFWSSDLSPSSASASAPSGVTQKLNILDDIFYGSSDSSSFDEEISEGEEALLEEKADKEKDGESNAEAEGAEWGQNSSKQQRRRRKAFKRRQREERKRRDRNGDRSWLQEYMHPALRYLLKPTRKEEREEEEHMSEVDAQDREQSLWPLLRKEALFQHLEVYTDLPQTV